MAWTDEARAKAAETRRRKALQNQHAAAMKSRRQDAIRNQGRSVGGKLTGYAGKYSTADIMKAMGTWVGRIAANYRAVKDASAGKRYHSESMFTHGQAVRAQTAPRSPGGKFEKKAVSTARIERTLTPAGGDLRLHAARLQELHQMSTQRPSLELVRQAKAVFDHARKIESGKIKATLVVKNSGKKVNHPINQVLTGKGAGTGFQDMADDLPW